MASRHLPTEICKECSAELLKVPFLKIEELNALPYGAIELDSAGSTLSYSQAEGALPDLDPARVIGKTSSGRSPLHRGEGTPGSFRRFLPFECGPAVLLLPLPVPG